MDEEHWVDEVVVGCMMAVLGEGMAMRVMSCWVDEVVVGG